MSAVHSPDRDGALHFLAGNSTDVFHQQVVHSEYSDLHMRKSKLDWYLKVEEHTS